MPTTRFVFAAMGVSSESHADLYGEAIWDP